ncbi:ribosome small subunit-dependent GTPase A [bacterium]|nr:ribosome small subunit-dependent GTPase A [bacterium]
MHDSILENFGYNDFFESNRKTLGLSEFDVARVISEHKGAYELINQNGKFLAKITGKQMFNAESREDYPAVGDWTLMKDLGNKQAVIFGILPRKTVIKRIYGDKDRLGNKNDVQIIATNIDTAFIVEAVNRDYNLNRFERYFAIVRNQEITPVIILNKADLIPKNDLGLIVAEIKGRFKDVDIILTSTLNDEGLNELTSYIEKGKTYCFLGSSGVGKSSLINKLLENNIIKVGDISEYSDRGKHTTTSREMYFLKNGGIVIDNPGIREVGISDISSGVNDIFNEIIELGKKCKFRNCTHTNESGCEILKALEEGRLDKQKYFNFLNIGKELNYFDMSKLEKRKKEKDFGKFINKVKKDLKNRGKY